MDLTNLLAAHRPGHTLDRRFYTDPAIFDAEIDRVFFCNWWFAGHVSELPNASDYFLIEIAGESLIVVRQTDGSIAAHFNVCRHRGSRICLETTGHVKKFVCQYHAWVYETDGRLTTAKHMPANFDAASHGLHPVAVRVAEGLIFVCPGDDPPDFTPALDAIAHLFQAHRLEQTTVCRHETMRLRCNWKIAAENTWECYHCPHSHPEYCSVMTHATAYESPRREADRAAALREWDAHARRLGHFVLERDRKWPADLFVNQTPMRPG